ncbi:MAG: acetyl-CoA carboxylase biotin carboxyl carrier protein subunit [Gemmatimonadota bacterium]
MTERRYYADIAARRGADGEAREAIVRGDGPGARGREGLVELVGGERAAKDGSAAVRELPSRGRVRRVLVGLDGWSRVAFAERRDGRWHVELEGRAYAVRVDDERTHEIRALTEEIAPAVGDVELRAPMPGLVVRIAVSPGDSVEAGDGVLVMEAMKMENELRAERGGVVAEVHVAEGATVDRDARLVTFEPDLEST